MNHSEVVDFLAGYLERPKTVVRDRLSRTFDVFTKLLDEKQDIVVPRLGIFETKVRQERKGFHPQVKKYMILPKKRVVTFHTGTSLRHHVNETGE